MSVYDGEDMLIPSKPASFRGGVSLEAALGFERCDGEDMLLSGKPIEKPVRERRKG